MSMGRSGRTRLRVFVSDTTSGKMTGDAKKRGALVHSSHITRRRRGGESLTHCADAGRGYGVCAYTEVFLRYKNRGTKKEP